MIELKGWLLDLFADTQSGIVLWLVGEDGQRHRLTQDFPITFYAAGETRRLRQLWRFLQTPAGKGGVEAVLAGDKLDQHRFIAQDFGSTNSEVFVIFAQGIGGTVTAYGHISWVEFD